jgi:AcrR family transcriptional regulator
MSELDSGLARILIASSSMANQSERADPAPDRHARRREQTRARLVQAARTRFARQGVENTRINEITDEADVGFGSFYNHFESKAAILEAVLMETVAARGGTVDAVTAQLDDPAEVIAAAHRHFVRLAGGTPSGPGWSCAGTSATT